MIDIHSHVLPAVDDGAAGLPEALAIVRAMARAGTNRLAATPHVRHDYPTSVALIEERLATLRAAVSAEGIAVEIVQGAEIAVDQLPFIGDDDLRRMTLATTGRYLLIESPYYGWPADLRRMFFDLALRGYTPVLAHPERNGVVQGDPGMIRPLVEGGALVQLTASSVSGRLGRACEKTSRRLLGLGLAHVVASDAHSADDRDIDLRAACGALRDRRLAEWLCGDVGAAILAGEVAPARPPRRRRWGRS